MHVVHVRDFAEWRAAARPRLAAAVPPREIEWSDGRSLFSAAEPTPPPGAGAAPRVAAAVMRLLETLALYRHDGRWDLMYRLAWRILYENPRLLEDAADADVRHAGRMEGAVRRDCHKMHAFVRFRELRDAHGERCYVAWFEPEHEILPRAAPFFIKRFTHMSWTIATPDGTAVWRNGALGLLPAPARGGDAHAPADPLIDLWRAYYRSICNVARLNPRAMQREMPRRYWRYLPEAAEIGPLLQPAGRPGSPGATDGAHRGASSPLRSTPPGPAPHASTPSGTA